MRSRRRIPQRFFDVGIAEGHAVTFAAGLATRGVRPVVAIYSTFLQRAYDNIIHDVAIQSLPVMFCMDRAGLVGEDGETHMGLYDIAYMLAVPEHDGHRAEGRDGDARRCCAPRSRTTAARSRFAIRATRRPTSRPPIAEIEPVPYAHVGSAAPRQRTSRSSPSARWCCRRSPPRTRWRPKD